MNPESSSNASVPATPQRASELVSDSKSEVEESEIAESRLPTDSTLVAFAASMKPTESESSAKPLTDLTDETETGELGGSEAPSTSEQPPVAHEANMNNVVAKEGRVSGDENPALGLSFSPEPDQVFQSSLTLSLFCKSPKAEIRYVLGAEAVDDNSPIYNHQEKIFLTQTTVITAQAFENGQRGPQLSAEFVVRKPIWQEIEPADQSDAVPHKRSEFLAAPDGWSYAAGSVRGKLHAHRGLWREDSFGLANIEAGDGVWSVVAVSDGAGSSPLSRIGSRLACDAAIESLRGSLGKIETLTGEQESLKTNDLPMLRDALIQCGIAGLEAIRAEAEARQQSISAFAATLLVLIHREWKGMQLCAALQVGDGSIALWDSTGLTLLGEADHGQHSSETRFLTTGGVEADLPARVRFSIKNDVMGFLVVSDGVSDDYFPEEKRLGEVFEAVLPLVQDKQADAGEVILGWLGYEKKGSSDDRTLVIGWPSVSSQAESILKQLPNQTEDSDGTTETADSHA